MTFDEFMNTHRDTPPSWYEIWQAAQAALRSPAPAATVEAERAIVRLSVLYRTTLKKVVYQEATRFDLDVAMKDLQDAIDNYIALTYSPLAALASAAAPGDEKE